MRIKSIIEWLKIHVSKYAAKCSRLAPVLPIAIHSTSDNNEKLAAYD
jgi:hypothetical protein